MRYKITVLPLYVKADLHNRKTAEETREFLDIVAAECVRNDRTRLLISVHDSRPIFTVEKYHLSSFLQIATRYSGMIALVADSLEVRVAHEYVAGLAQAAGVEMRSFHRESEAVRWLTDAE